MTLLEHRELLLNIGRLYGIDGDYFDVWGHRHEVPAATQEALLEAMGLPLGELGRMPGVAEREAWSTVLEPVYVIPGEEAERRLLLHLPDGEARFHWTCQDEPGNTLEGDVETTTLQHLETREFDGHIWRRYLWTLPFPLKEGRHRLVLRLRSATVTSILLVTPSRCYRPPCLEHGRVWGFAVQLYAVRSRRNWGMGDFTDLVQLVHHAHALGAAVIGLNPLHALFLHNPDHASPYSPSTRLFLNPLYIDVEAVPGFAECETVQKQVCEDSFRGRIATYRNAPYVDYLGVWGIKSTILDHLHRWFRAHAQPEIQDDFRAFQARGGEALFRYAVHEALQEAFFSQDPSIWGWPVWPAEYRQPDGAAVHEFAKARAERVEFFQYLQWQAAAQLHEAGALARELLGIGLYRDLAVGVDRGGAETWASQGLYVFGASVGCPPDELNLNGQNWGLPPLSPKALKYRAYEPYLSTWSANMHDAGALRIDHVMGLFRLFWVPNRLSPREGAYVHYPMDDLFRLLALESQRQQCLVVGEDLGTVPDAIRHALSDYGILSYRLLYFERDAQGRFKRPGDYPTEALVAATTHDLPTLAGFWTGIDLEERRQLNLFPSKALEEQQIRERAEDKRRLVEVLEAEGLMPPGSAVPARPSRALALAIYTFLARTPCRMLLVQMEDVTLAREAVNLPGTSSERPNWRRKLDFALEAMEDTALPEIAQAMKETGRGR